jgi:hypothetical protein
MYVPHANKQPIDYALRDIKQDAEDLVRAAVMQGVVLTIEQKPLKPLAMGHYLPIIEVRPAREQS